MTSHLAWTQDTPLDWTVKPLRAVADYVVSNVDKIPVDGELAVRLCNYSEVYNNEFITSRLDFMTCTATKDEIRKFGLRVNDVIITKDSEKWDDIGVPTLVAETASDLVCGYHLALLRPKEALLSGRFLFRCLQAKVLRVQLELSANGVTRFGLSKSEIGALRLPVPPLKRQVAITNFLDSETARIDALVAAKQRVLDLLAEKRKAIIATAVTRGLDPTVKLRDSGVPWLGEMPEHWKVKPVKYIAQMKSGEAITADRIDDLGPFPVYGGNGMRGYTASYTHEGEFALVGRQGALCGNVHLASGRFWASEHAIVASVVDGSMTTWLTELFRIMNLNQYAQSAAQPGLAVEQLMNLRIPVPPQEEQHAIVMNISRETAQLDAVLAATQRAIALLKERRAAMIAAAVTGQIGMGEGV